MVLIKIQVFWDVTPCYCSTATDVAKALYPYKMLVTIYQSTFCKTPHNLTFI